jgi:hypothetical protein
VPTTTTTTTTTTPIITRPAGDKVAAGKKFRQAPNECYTLCTARRELEVSFHDFEKSLNDTDEFEESAKNESFLSKKNNKALKKRDARGEMVRGRGWNQRKKFVMQKFLRRRHSKTPNWPSWVVTAEKCVEITKGLKNIYLLRFFCPFPTLFPQNIKCQILHSCHNQILCLA